VCVFNATASHDDQLQKFDLIYIYILLLLLLLLLTACLPLEERLMAPRGGAGPPM
jgi:hypothetical protein